MKAGSKYCFGSILIELGLSESGNLLLLIQTTNQPGVPDDPITFLFTSRRLFLIECKPNQPGYERAIWNNRGKSEEVICTLGKVAFTPHLIDVILAIAGFPQRRRIFRIIDYVIELVKQSPTNIKSFERALVSHDLLEVSKVDLHYVGWWLAGGGLFPPPGNYTTERNLRTLARVLENYHVASIDYLFHKLPRALRTTNGLLTSQTQYSGAIKLQLRPPRDLPQLARKFIATRH